MTSLTSLSLGGGGKGGKVLGSRGSPSFSLLLRFTTHYRVIIIPSAFQGKHWTVHLNYAHTHTCTLHSSDYASYHIAIFFAHSYSLNERVHPDNHTITQNTFFLNLEPIKEYKQLIGP